MKRITSEPLLHFLMIGMLIFITTFLLNPQGIEQEVEGVIIVDEPRLVRFLQYLSKNPARVQAQERLLSLSKKQREQLIDAYVEEEVLFREAQALGLDKNDQAVRQRMVQQARYLLEAVVVDHKATEQQLTGFYQNNIGDYAIPSTITFTHIFLSSESHGQLGAREMLQALQQHLNDESVSFADAPKYGDRFVYKLNYVDSTQEEVASHFGETMAQQAFTLQAHEGRWQGPLASSFGYHLILIVKNTPRYSPSYNEVKDKVEADYQYQQRQIQMQKALSKLLDNYEVDLRDVRTKEPASPVPNSKDVDGPIQAAGNPS